MPRKKSSSKGVSAAIDAQMRSDQPVFQDTSDIMERDIQIGKALNWYNALSTDKKERKWYWEYAKENNLFSKEELARIKVADSKLFVRLGRFARMVLDGFPLDHDDFIQRRMESGKLEIQNYLKPKAKKTEKETTTSNRLSVQDRMDEKAEELTGSLLNMIDEYIGSIQDIKKSDDGDHVNVESFLNVEEVKPLIAKRILNHIQEQASEWDDVVGSTDKDIKEAYSYLTVSEQKRIQRMYKKVLDELGVRAAQTQTRKPRKKRVRSAEEVVKKVKYQESCKDTGVDSISPEKIIGAARVILFNTKYREYQIIEAENEKLGLRVEGTTIKGIDKTKSVCKRVRENYVQNLLNITLVKGIRAIRSEYKGIKAKENTPTGRINDNTLILRAMK